MRVVLTGTGCERCILLRSGAVVELVCVRDGATQDHDGGRGGRGGRALHELPAALGGDADVHVRPRRHQARARGAAVDIGFLAH